MNRCRFAFVPVLFLLLALPLAADMRTAPAKDGATPASIEGTITSINIPIAGGGPIVTLLGGLVSFDATGASVRLASGEAGTTASLAVGQRIAAFVDPASSPLKATSIVVFEQRAEVALTGPVQAVDATAKTLAVLGFTFRVDANTVFGGPWDGAGQASLSDVKVGDLVLVAAKADAGSLLALKVMKLSPTPTPMSRIHGVVASVGTESWTITLKDGTAQPVKVDAQTKYVGDPKVGDEVDVLARRQSDGTLLAVLVAKTVAPPAADVERYQGVVKSVSATAWTVGPKVGDGPDRLFAVNAKTQLVGDPKVGDEVGVLAQKQADGSYLALVIAKLSATVPVGAASFDGVVKSIAAPSSGMAMGAVWTVDTTKVLVTRATTVTGDPKVGDRVHVEGLKSPDGSVMAKTIAKL
jgi:hypothetical protein